MASSGRESRAAPARVLIVDDSLVARTVLARLIEDHGGFTVVGSARGAAEALAMLDDRAVDLILLDVEMPGTDGLTALPALIERSGGARVLIVSSQCGSGAAASVRALTLGAVDTMLKPSAAQFGGAFANELTERLARIVSDPTPRRAAAPAAPVRDAVILRRDAVRCLAIGASTGGPHALAAFLGALSPAFRAPILLTQHLPPSFMPFFADQLRELSGRPVAVAVDGARLAGGAILLAPGDAHLALRRREDGEVAVALDRTPAASGCCPSVDPMLVAVAETFGAQGAGVILTGMGRDGLAGSTRLAAAGGEILVQDAATSVVWGMPGAVAGAGLADLIAPPALLAQTIAARGSA
ncbi:MAG: chemotaxis-specific protein-glutamate methyltransferase CheB [Sphingomonas sp.]